MKSRLEIEFKTSLDDYLSLELTVGYVVETLGSKMAEMKVGMSPRSPKEVYRAAIFPL